MDSRGNDQSSVTFKTSGCVCFPVLEAEEIRTYELVVLMICLLWLLLSFLFKVNSELRSLKSTWKEKGCAFLPYKPWFGSLQVILLRDLGKFYSL